MSILQRIQHVLADRGLPEAGPERYGYCLEEGPRASAIVRWGRGEPFRDAHHSGLRTCDEVLRRAGLHTSIVRFNDPAGHYLQVTDRPRPSGGV